MEVKAYEKQCGKRAIQKSSKQMFSCHFPSSCTSHFLHLQRKAWTLETAYFVNTSMPKVWQQRKADPFWAFNIDGNILQLKNKTSNDSTKCTTIMSSLWLTLNIVQVWNETKQWRNYEWSWKNYSSREPIYLHLCRKFRNISYDKYQKMGLISCLFFSIN